MLYTQANCPNQYAHKYTNKQRTFFVHQSHNNICHIHRTRCKMPLKLFFTGVSDIADAVAMRKDKFIKRYLLNSSVVCEICSLIVK